MNESTNQAIYNMLQAEVSYYLTRKQLLLFFMFLQDSVQVYKRTAVCSDVGNSLPCHAMLMY